MLKVIRIEHPSDGQGIFQSKDEKGEWRLKKHSAYNWIMLRHSNGFVFPSYNNDSDLQYAFEIEGNNSWSDLEKYNFAYLSLDQMKTGFESGWIKESIEKHGYRVLMYTLDKDYFQSQYQVIFIKSSAVSVEDISSLFL